MCMHVQVCVLVRMCACLTGIGMYSKFYFRPEKKNQAVKLQAKWLALATLTVEGFSKKSDVVSCVRKTGCNLRECIPIEIIY